MLLLASDGSWCSLACGSITASSHDICAGFFVVVVSDKKTLIGFVVVV